jgi:NTP pyrophosphatase (non-canonical NTP hydrolase)
MRFDQLEDAVVDWADDRGIFKHSNAQAQLLKAVSEMGELADAVIKKDYAGTEDAVGDVLVCLINFCAFYDISPTYCLKLAWNQIKDRKGHMVAGGAFVKEETK